MKIYHSSCFSISQVITRNYSTSFYIASSLLDNKMKKAIYSIYGFVRLADEIVDTFHEYNKKELLEKLEKEIKESLSNGLSINPIIHSFTLTVKKYNIPFEHVQAFIDSMKFDLHKKEYTHEYELKNYIYGSADVVGLMCLRVFCNGNETLYKDLEHPAMKLGSAFQKVNFLRDLKTDMEELDRVYFPEMLGKQFNEHTKKEIIQGIEYDFNQAIVGIRKLPQRSKLAVLIAYYYYRNLLKKLKNAPTQVILNERISISSTKKLYLLAKAAVVYKFNLL